MVEISETNRINVRTLSNEIQEIESEYSKLANIATKNLREKKDELWKQESEFKDRASDFIRELTIGDKLHIKTQVGPNGGTIINTYPNCTLDSVSVIGRRVNTFNVTSPDIYDGKPWTIGLSCLLSIKKYAVDNDENPGREL